MSAARAAIEEAGAEVVVVTFEPWERLAAYRDDHALGMRVVSDPERVVYRGLGLGRGSLGRVWGPRVLWRYVRLLWGGRRMERLGSDLYQLGGDAVLDRRGEVAWLHRSTDPVDRPPVAALVAAVRDAAQSRK